MTLPTPDLVACEQCGEAFTELADNEICERCAEIGALYIRVQKADARAEKFLKVTRSVLSEEGVKEYLLAYVMGAELIQMVEEEA